MAAQEAIHGLHAPPYVKSDPSSNGYNYAYASADASYANHFNPYVHYGEQYNHLGQPHHYNNQPGQYPQMQQNPYNAMEGQHSSSYYEMMPNQAAPVYKEEPSEDPYSFVDEASSASAAVKIETNPVAEPKKRGRKKKVPVLEEGQVPLTMDLMPVDGSDDPNKSNNKSEHSKQRRKHDRFNGMSEEEVRSKTLPDHLTSNLDVVIIGINPGLFAAYKGHHYAGPGNHFWKCLFLAGLVPEAMTADDDFKMLHFGIGFTNMVARPTKGSADLTRKEIREGGRILLEKLQRFRPKIAVFNGKGIYEVFSGKKEFTFGKQPECIDGTNTFIWVMPSSSARCAQLPRAMDKVPFYAALKKFRDYLNGLIPEIDENEVVFNDPKIRAADDGTEISEHLKVDSVSSDDVPALMAANEFPNDERQPAAEIPVKKKRGRPKKIREDGTVAVKKEKPPPSVPVDGELPKKKRGRPKKVRTDEIVAKPGGNQSDNTASPSTYQPMNHMEYYGRSPGNGPLSGLCNDMSPQTPQPTTPRQPDFDPVKRETNSSENSPPQNYRPTPPASAPYQNQDVATKSLSGLESLVDQIPNMAEGDQHAAIMHLQQNPAANNFSHYASQPNFSYSASSFGHYSPHYTMPGGGIAGGFPYNQGGQEHGFNGSNYPVGFNGASGPGGFAYAGYGQSYPPNGAASFPPYASSSGFHPSTSYAYTTSSGVPVYSTTYTTQAGYPNHH